MITNINSLYGFCYEGYKIDILKVSKASAKPEDIFLELLRKLNKGFIIYARC